MFHARYSRTRASRRTTSKVPPVFISIGVFLLRLSAILRNGAPDLARPGRIRVIYSGRTFRHKTHNGGIPALGGRSCRRSITSSQLASRICLGGAALLTLLSPKRRKKTRPSFAPAETDMLERDPRTFPVTPSRVQASSRRSSPRLARRSSY
jgi:hypothetical protein